MTAGESFGTLAGKGPVDFAVGDRVVYPHHGAAIIERREQIVWSGKQHDYFVLRIAHGDLTLKVPTDSVEEVGLRSVIDPEEVAEVLVLLGKPCGREPANWSRRFKNNVEKLKSGDIYQVAELVRNLSRRRDDKHLSTGEQRLLLDARRILLSELKLATGSTDEHAEALLDGILSRPPTP